MKPIKTAIIIINWNGFADTIECLKSFTFSLASEYIFIIDNDSSDTSIKEINNYLQTSQIPFSTFEEAVDQTLPLNESIHHYLIKGRSNRGFAGGNNYVINLIYPIAEFEYFWLLNNDTVIEKNSLSELIQTMQQNPSTGFVGSVVLDYKDRNKIQCCGCKLYPYLGVAKMILKDRPIEDVIRINNYGDYQSGASLMVKREVIEKVGLFDLRFFMYSEECDWQIRSNRAGYKNTIAPKSIIYHKGTVSTQNRRHLFYYYYNQSSMILIRKNFSKLVLLTSSIALTGITLIRTKGNLKNFLYGMKGIISGLKVDLRNPTKSSI